MWSFVEVANFEYQQKFTSVPAETLDRVRDAAWEIPKVADTDLVDAIAAQCIDRRDACVAEKHVSPFGLFVPMQFSYGYDLTGAIKQQKVVRL